MRIRMMARMVLGMVLGLSAAVSVSAPEAVQHAVHVSHLSSRDGLSVAWVTAAAQDANGFIWVGTANGLNRFDGRELRVFRGANAPSAPTGYIQSVLCTPDGAVWVGTISHGLFRRDPVSGEFLNLAHEQGNRQSLAGVTPKSLAVDGKGVVWAALGDQGIDRVSANGQLLGHWHPVKPREGTAISETADAIALDHRGGLWVAGGGRVTLYDPDTGATLNSFDLIPGKPAGQKWNLAVDASRNAVWAVADGYGLWRLSRTGEAAQHWSTSSSGAERLPTNALRGVAVDSSGGVWLASEAGVLEYHGRGFIRHIHDPLDPHSLADDDTLSIFVDKGDEVWVGTREHGIDRFESNSLALGHLVTPTLTSGGVYALAEGDETSELLVGTLTKGLMRLDRGALTLSEVAGPSWLQKLKISALLRDAHKNLWIGTRDGQLILHDHATGVYLPQTLPLKGRTYGITGIHLDDHGSVWVSLYLGGVCRADGAGRYTCIAGPDDTKFKGHAVTDIVDTGDGRYWISTLEAGLYRWNPASGEVEEFPHDSQNADSLGDEAITALYVDKKGTLWIALQSAGLDRLEKFAPGSRPRFRHFRESDGLPSESIYGFEPDEFGNLWLATGHGLSRFHIADGKVQNFDEEQGAQNLDFNFGAHLSTRDGYIVLGGAGGINRFRPGDIDEIPSHVPLLVTRIEVNNRPVALSDSQSLPLRLGYQDTGFTVDVAALNFTQPEAMRFRYRLEGFDKEWIDNGTRTRIAYTNLSRGTYQLRVKAMAADGVTSAEMAPLSISVAGPPWSSPWAIVAFLMVLVSLFGLGLDRTLRRNERREAYARELEKRVHERTTELESSNLQLQEATQARASFVARMSHELRTPMNGVIGISELLMGTRLDAAQRRFVRSIMTSAESLVDILSNILDFSRLENIPAQIEQVEFDLDALIEQTVDLFVGRAAEKSIEIVYGSPGVPLPKVIGDPLRLRQVLSNLIGNAVKFTLKGHVLVRLEASLHTDVRRGQFQIHVTDTGVGIRPENLEKIFSAFTQEDGSTTRRFGGSGLGLTIARQLMLLMGGQIRVESKVGEGSHFTVTVPMTLATDGAPRREAVTVRAHRVYVVDPSSAVRDVITSWLGVWRVPATGCADWSELPNEAWSHVGSGDVVLVAGELWNDRSNGPVQLWRGRDPSHRPRIAVLCSFGGGLETDVDPLVGASLIKPLRWHELQHILGTLSLGSSRFRSSLPKKSPTTPQSVLDILVVDDQEINRTVGVGLLQSLGHRAAAVDGGEAAVEAVRSMRYDVVLMDCQMPGMDGFDATTAIKSLREGDGPGPVIIAVTADTTDESRARCVAVGMDGFLAKPISRNALARVLADVQERVNA